MNFSIEYVDYFVLNGQQELQHRIESLELELYRKEAHIGILEQKHNRVDQQLKDNICESEMIVQLIMIL